MPPVLATACLVGFIEWACIEALHPFLDQGEHTLGTHVDVSHVAPTPAGMMVSAEVELIAVEGRKLRFKVSCRDEDGLIGEGFHERAVIDHARFDGPRCEQGAEVRNLPPRRGLSLWSSQGWRIEHVEVDKQGAGQTAEG